MTDEEPSPPAKRSPEGAPRTTPPGFANIRTLVIACVLIFTLPVLALSLTPAERIELLRAPVRSVQRIFERDLELSEAIASSSPWIRRSVEVVMSWPADPLAAAIDAYGEVYAERSQKALPDESSDLAQLQIRRAILSFEAGRPDDADRSLQTVETRAPGLVALVRRAYGQRQSDDAVTIGDEAASELREGWARDRLELHLAERAGDDARVARLRELKLANDDRWRSRATVLALAFDLPCLAGLVLLCVWLLRNRPALLGSSAAIPPAWTWESGFSVLARTALAGIAIQTALFLANQWLGTEYFDVWTTLLASLPMLWWIRHYLTEPTGSNLVTTFGMRPASRAALTWIGLTLAVIAVDQLGSSVISVVTSSIGVDAHWSEFAREDLIWSSRPLAILRSIDGTIWAPVLEEIGFRGLLYMTLRRRLGVGGAALVSAGLFSAVHMYSLPGLLSVCWSGIVYAIAVERSRSLVPVIVAHAANNILALGAGWMLYR